jgi:hypothetical protein
MRAILKTHNYANQFPIPQTFGAMQALASYQIEEEK